MSGNRQYAKKADEFRDQYNKDHEACPKCGSLIYMTTLVGFIVNMSEPEKYQDKNKCTCESCGDVHITHDRVPKK